MTDWYSGPGEPSPTLGVDGDFYILTGNVFHRMGGQWTKKPYIAGPPGMQGPPGPQGPPGTSTGGLDAGNIDGGYAETNYRGIPPIDLGGAL